MPHDINEADWKVMRQLHPVALDRLCDRILKEAAALCVDTGRSRHQRYLDLFALIKRRDEDVALAFNGMRRSGVVSKLMAIKQLGLVTDAEFDRFSPEMRQTVLDLSAHHAMS